MTLKTSLVIGGDAAGGVAAVDQATAAVGRLDGAQRAAAGGAALLGQAEERVSRATRDHTRASNDNAGALARHAAGARNLGQQFGDLGLSIAGGISPARAFGQQAGQLGYALGEMGGAAGKVGAFLTGPWGIALTVGLAVLAPFVEELFKGEQAASDFKLTSTALADAQSVLAAQFELGTGALKRQTEAAIVATAALSTQLATQARLTQQKANRTIDAAGEPGVKGTAIGLGAILLGSNNNDVRQYGFSRLAGNAAVRKLREDLAAARNITDEIKRARAEEQVILRAQGTDFANSGVSRTDFIQAIADRTRSDNDLATGFRAIRSSRTGVLDPSFRSGGSAGGRTRGASSRAGAGAASGRAAGESGGDAAARLAAVGEGFDDTPPALKRVNTALRQIDELVRGLNAKKPVGFATMIDEAERLRDVVRNGLTAPLRDFIKSQGESFAVGEALLAGDTARAEVLKTIAGLERQMGPLTAAQKAAVESTVAALDAQARQLDILHAKQQVYLDGLGQIRGIVDDATQAFVRGDLGQFVRTPGKLLDAFQSVQGEALFDKLFDGAFRELQDAVTGTSIAGDAADRMAAAVDAVTAQTGRTTAALQQLGNAAGAAANGIAGGGAFDGSGPNHELDRARGDVIVRAGPKITRSPSDLFTEAIGKVAGTIGDKLGVKNPEVLGKAIGKFAGKGLEGAAAGSLVAGVANAVGLKLNKTGSQVGGAIGGFLPIPGGAVIGSVLGGIVGSLFGAKPKQATAAITSTGAAAGIAGNNGDAKKAATSLAGAVQQGVAQIAQQLGGQLGNYNVSIGTFDGKYRVSTTGFTGSLDSKKAKGQGLVDFGTDGQDAAIAYAIQDAIKDGAVTGLSVAVAQALGSSPDINTALAEALKVQDLQLTIGGLGATLRKAFADFETTAKERVRIARQYGFDVIAIDQRNADDREKLSRQLLKSQVGSIQQLLDEVQQGSLFEGSAIDRIGALTASIAKAKADLAAGVDGAGDNLASLEQQRLGVAKEAYGTTGGYADYRQQTVNEAQAAIAAANAQIVAARSGDAKSDPALATTNAALDENNDQNAEMLAVLKRNNELVAQLLARPTAIGGGFNFGQLAAY